MGDSDWQEVSHRKRRSVFDRLGVSLVNLFTVYVSNFPTHLTIRELSNICGKRGNIVDVYIAKHKNKFGQMFGFIRYSGIENQDILIDSLNGIWIGKLRLHANIARFAKSDRKEGVRKAQATVKSAVKPVVQKSVNRVVNCSQSFSNAVKGVFDGEKSDCGGMAKDDCSTIVASRDDNPELESAILGCYKDFRSIVNSNIICRNEGFIGVDVKYLGGLWVLFSFQDTKARDCFLKHEGVKSWFSELKPWHDDFVLQERLVWLEIEGVPIRAWNNDTFNSICSKYGEVLFIDETDSSNRFSIRVCIKTSHHHLIFASTTVTLKGVSYIYRVRELRSWTPNFTSDVGDSDEEESVDNACSKDSDKNEDDDAESVGEFIHTEDNKVNHDHVEEGNIQSVGEFIHMEDNKGNHDQVEEGNIQSVGEFIHMEDNKVNHDQVKEGNIQPNDSDPFELEPLIAKKGNYQAEKNNYVTPKYPPGFTLSDKGFSKHDHSEVNKPDSKTSQSSHVKEDEVPKNRSVGNGSTTSFWGDSWCGGRPLKEQYPRVYALDLNKSCSVADRMGIEDWSSLLRRTPRGGAESNQFADLIQSVQQVTLTSSADAWKWELSSFGFSVASTRQYVDDQTLLGSLSSTRWIETSYVISLPLRNIFKTTRNIWIQDQGFLFYN
ncbi:hypothetical protein CTI12_AA491790 [Artemisia annua]|uniref:RRM domain-containing protein n=1 Tax=Artemisia annua TaxID=35608 RepID=A0A2U1LH61_ARTAN|nr:hypothetical protein CTI12_AA491790 [Artemisia annua]